MDNTTLLDFVEYTMRNNRHIIDAAWNEHHTTSEHERPITLDNSDLVACVVCIVLASATNQNDILLANFLEERKKNAE